LRLDSRIERIRCPDIETPLSQSLGDIRFRARFMLVALIATMTQRRPYYVNIEEIHRDSRGKVIVTVGFRVKERGKRRGTIETR
jgi:hypothetical protein